MVQEYGEIDLARLLAKHDATRRAAAGADLAKGALLQDNLDENFIRLYWQQMLQVRTLDCWGECCTVSQLCKTACQNVCWAAQLCTTSLRS
jgi:hypothetical protein